MYETDVLIRLTRNSQDPDREDAIRNYHTENADRQGEIDDLRYVLDRLAAPRQLGWSAELKLALFVLSSVVLLLAALAVVRTF